MVSPSTDVASVHYRQVVQPSFVKVTKTSTSTSQDFIGIATRGKANIGFNIEKSTGYQITATIYGAQTPLSSVGDADVRQLDGTPITINSSVLGDYEVARDPFPFYIVRLASTAAANKATAHINILS